MKHHDPQSHKNAVPSPAHIEPKNDPSIADRVRLRAYQIFESRNGRPGDPVSDWQQAEREVLGTTKGQAAEHHGEPRHGIKPAARSLVGSILGTGER